LSYLKLWFFFYQFELIRQFYLVYLIHARLSWRRYSSRVLWRWHIFLLFFLILRIWKYVWIIIVHRLVQTCCWKLICLFNPTSPSLSMTHSFFYFSKACMIDKIESNRHFLWISYFLCSAILLLLYKRFPFSFFFCIFTFLSRWVLWLSLYHRFWSLHSLLYSIQDFSKAKTSPHGSGSLL
jgi:hypothetical protein